MDSREKLEKLRALIQEETDKKNNGGRSSTSRGDNASYPFWDIPENSMATIRFVPDLDDDNPWFWVERQTIKLTFEGVVGGDYPTNDTVTLTVPCVEMFGDACPIIAHIRPWWKKDANGQDNPMRETARKYYKKRSYISSGFVVTSPFEEENVPENPLRRFIFGSSLIEKIKAGLADPDMENLPTDYLAGYDFRIRKTRKQEYNNYDTSKWAGRSRALTEQEQIAIQKHGLYNLKTFLGPRPDADGIAEIKAMFLASLNGDPFDHESFGEHYRPYGGGSRSNDGDTQAAMKPQASVNDDDVGSDEPTPDRATTAKSSNPNPQDLMTKLRSRSTNHAA